MEQDITGLSDANSKIGIKLKAHLPAIKVSSGYFNFMSSH